MNGSLCYSASSLFGKSVVDQLISGIVGDFVNSKTNHSVYLLTGFFVPKKRVNNKINKITLLFPLFKCLPWFRYLACHNLYCLNSIRIKHLHIKRKTAKT